MNNLQERKDRVIELLMALIENTFVEDELRLEAIRLLKDLGAL